MLLSCYSILFSIASSTKDGYSGHFPLLIISRYKAEYVMRELLAALILTNLNNGLPMPSVNC